MELIATCAFGLEKLVYDELKKIGCWIIKTEDGRVTFKGDAREIVLANLWLRCAERLHIKMAEFSATTFDALFDQITALEWEKYIGVQDAFPVHATSTKSILHSTPAIQSIVKKAIVKRLQLKHKSELLPENSGAVYQVIVKANKNQFVISINSSGESLHKRGYRTKTNAAPIKETLAAAMIKLSDWIPEYPLIDPFCGSGTIAIEAALIAENRAPGLHREFAFQKWQWIDQKIIATVYKEAEKAIKPAKKIQIYGFDNDLHSLEIAEENTHRAGLKGKIDYKCSDFKNLNFSAFKNCTFITNPPYGERMEEKKAVEKMYGAFGKKFAETTNCSLFLITSNEHFPRLFGREANKNRKLFNGNIRCYLFSYCYHT